MDRFRATSYGPMGVRAKSITIEATSLRAAVNHPKIRTLPVAGTTQGGQRARVVGIARV